MTPGGCGVKLDPGVHRRSDGGSRQSSEAIEEALVDAKARDGCPDPVDGLSARHGVTSLSPSGCSGAVSIGPRAGQNLP